MNVLKQQKGDIFMTNADFVTLKNHTQLSIANPVKININGDNTTLKTTLFKPKKKQKQKT